MNNQFVKLSSQKVKIEDFTVVSWGDDEDNGFSLMCPDPLCPWAEHDTVRSLSDLLNWAREHKKAHQKGIK